MTQKFDMNQYNTLAEAIASLLAPYDTKTIESQVAYADQAQVKMKEYQDSEEGRKMRRTDSYRFAAKLLNIAGNKSWSHIIRETGLGI